MSDKAAARGVPDDVLAYLQELMLTAVLLRQRLPGSRLPLYLPGLERLLESGVVELLNQRLANQLALDGMPSETRLRSAAELRTVSEGGQRPTRYYLAFGSAERQNGHIRLSLMLRRLQAGARQPELVSRIDVVFQRDGERWRAAGEPTVFVTDT